MPKETKEKLTSMLKSIKELQTELQSLSLVLEDFKRRLVRREVEEHPLSEKAQDG